MELKTTLSKILSYNPCGSGWEKLLESLGENKDFPDLNREVTLKFILENNGVFDALWSTRCFTDLETSTLMSRRSI